MCGCFLERLDLISAARDVVSLEHRGCLVPADRHRHRLGNSSADHISDGGASEIVEQPSTNLGAFESGVPDFPEIDNRLTSTMKDKLAELRCAVLLFDGSGSPPSSFDESPQFAFEWKDPSEAVLGCSQPNLTRCPVYSIPPKWNDLASTPP